MLVQFLGNPVGRHLGVKELISYDLSNHLIGSPVIALRAAFGIFQPLGAIFQELAQDLIIPLSGVAELLCGLGGTKAFALALEEHREFQGDFIIFLYGDGAFGTFKRQYPIFDSNHVISS